MKDPTPKRINNAEVYSMRKEQATAPRTTTTHNNNNNNSHIS